MIFLLQQFSLPALAAFLSFFNSLFPQAHLTVLQHKTIVHGPPSFQKKEHNVSSSSPSNIPGVIQNQTTPIVQISPTSATRSQTKQAEDNTIGVLPSPTESQVTKSITAKSTISASGKTIYLSMKYPSSGGKIAGTISGDCTGTISGTYAGPSSGSVQGNGNAQCPVGFINIPVTLTYSGTVISPTSAHITYTAQGAGKTESGNTTLTLNEES